MNSVKAQEDQLHSELVALAPKELENFRLFLGRLWNALQLAPDPWGPTRPTIIALLDAIADAREEAAEMIETGLPIAKLRERLEARVAALRKLAAEMSLPVPSKVWSWSVP